MEELKKIISDFISKVKENPGTLFGFLYPYVLIIVVIIGLYYVANVGNVALNKMPAFIVDTTVITDLTVVPARTVPPIDIFKFKEATSEILQKGKELYSKNCASCHNETGAGGGPASIGLNPAPRNFTSPDGWKNGRTLSAIYTTLEEGIQGSGMISYNFLTPEERISLAHYIKTEFMKDPPADTDDDLAALNQLYNLSAGMQVPAQIPVSAAMQIINDEADKRIKKLDEIISLIEKEKNSNEVRLFSSITYDKRLAISSLLNSSRWRTGENEFMYFLTLNDNQNGFKGNVLYLSNRDISELYNYLNRML